MRSSGGLEACREHVSALRRGPSPMTLLPLSERYHLSGGCGFAAAEVLLCRGWRLCSGGGAALQRLADLRRPGCSFAAAGGFAAAGVWLCSGWRLRSGLGEALQRLAALQRRRLRLCSSWRLCSGRGCSWRLRSGWRNASAAPFPSGSHSDSGRWLSPGRLIH